MTFDRPAIVVTFQGREYVLTADIQTQAFFASNRYHYRYDVGARSYAWSIRILARALDVDTYTAGTLARWVCPDGCNLVREGSPRVLRTLTKEEEHAWYVARAVARHEAEIAANGGVCTDYAHRNNRVCPRVPGA